MEPASPVVSSGRTAKTHLLTTNMKKSLVFILVSAALVANIHAGIFNVIHSFGSPLTNVGVEPAGGVVPGPDGTLYGVDFNGGINNYGTIYSFNANGCYALWNFADSGDGAYPVGDLILDGTTLYGITSGNGGAGGLFKIQTDGTGFSVLHNFTSSTDGSAAAAGLVMSGNVFYGVCPAGGSGGTGTVFKMNSDGSGFQVLHHFTSIDPAAFTNADGAYPEGKLVLDGNTLYGTTYQGGNNQFGSVFSVQIDGSAFAVLHVFDSSEGMLPVAGLTLSGTKLFGTTYYGGTDGNGTIFTLNTDGSGYTTLYSLANGGNDGIGPRATLLLSGNTLFGSAYEGGANGNGTLFSLQTDGTGFNLFYTFSALDPNYYDNNDGANPISELLLYHGVLCGTAPGGGLIATPSYSQNFGTLFQVNPDGTGFSTDYFFDNTSASTDGYNPECPLVISGNTVYGMTYLGGLDNYGGVFKVNRDGTGFVLLHSFGFAEGAYPVGGLALAGNTLYGTTISGGAFVTNGVVFSMNTDGTGYSVLHSFAGGTEGYEPSAGVTIGGGALYGTTYNGGSNGYGTVYRLDLNTLQLQTLLHFAVTNGAHPNSPLVLSGSTLYGETPAGGVGAGNLFKMQTDGAGFTNLRVFSFTTGEGSQGEGETPEGGLILNGGTLYGTSANGGENHTGNVFKINTDGTGYETLFNFDPTAYNGITQTNSDGANPGSALALYGNTLYGTATYGGAYGYGTLFEVNTNANGEAGFTNLHTFTSWTGFESPVDGGYPGGGVLFSEGQLLGVAGVGGIFDYGVAYRYDIVPPLHIAVVSNTPFIYWQPDGENHTLQFTMDISTGPWSNAPAINFTNIDNNRGVLMTNKPLPAPIFFRLMD